MAFTRREALGIAATVSAGVLLEGGEAMAAEAPAAAVKADARPAQHAPVPLPFDAKKLRGLSERMISSHWENNYGGALKNLNKVEEELQRITKDTPGFLVSGLRERELTFTNSVILHEHYFGNLGGDGKPGGPVQAALSDAFGSLGRWEELFRATGASLGGGSGWAILDWSFHTSSLRTYWSGNHTQALASGTPLLVLDMYEHSYAIDYGASAAKYLDAFFQNVNWDEVNRRFERAKKAGAVLRGA